ncbi:Por secretion system C-terminal sorting domain-containing protein [Dyadobacter soli]|uniref:Por secretion system C-terminal sorting domain-containing protein n=1 Tax=Dyadobacter soli TaxID=659014 RepID=A0A1G8C1N2_9BACT|nr:FG-GAP-like repeat-containing protein [Dyadobacter soli]SDH39284.1 Por secretion system C-terminal sorting domain-containing protein [Dyadobacter soli]
MKSRYMPILYVGMVLAAFAAGFKALDRISRSISRNPSKVRTVPAAPAKVSEAALSETTLSDIRSMLEKQEYHISYDKQKNMLQSPNRAHNLRAYYQPGKLTVQTRVDTTGQGFRLQLMNEGVYADGKLLHKPETNAKAAHHQNKVQISHDAFTEEFINNEDGVRQNFIIEKAPAGTRQLQVKMTTKGLKVRQGSGNELRFYTEASNGETRNELVYNDLRCWDANKQPLNATLTCMNNRIQITVDVANAAYPVTIDPIIANGTPQNANKILEINQSQMWLGFSVSSAGDVNGDGYSDVIVGAPQYDSGQNNEGAAFVYPGKEYGLSLAAVTLECNQADAKMGYSVSSAGDFNGDGFSDVLVGIPNYHITGQNDGMVKLYFGSADGVKANSIPMDLSPPTDGGYFGISVATAGDINADGFSDILVGAHQATLGQANEGIVLAFYGAITNYGAWQVITAGQADAKFGYSVAPAGDVDADGYSDVIIGSRFYGSDQSQAGEGAAYIYRGSANGLLDNNPTIIEGNQYDAAMGNKVSSAGDVNGDGYSDVLISAYLYDAPNLKDQGRVYLHLGSSNGINPLPEKTFEGGQVDARMGSSIACAGDVNGDGYSDILLGTQYYDNGQFNEGAVFLYHGSKDGIVGTWASLLESNQANAWFGTAIASAGDVNGDGYSDIMIGCHTFDNGQTDEGHVFVYHGSAGGINPTGHTQITSNNPGAEIGFSVATAGDVNADGYSDVVVGAPYYDLGENNEGVAFVYYGSQAGLVTNTCHTLQENKANSRFGRAVSGAGDVNGDGFDDIVVGADAYTNGQEDEGAIFIYHGSSTGIGTQAVIHFERNFAESYMGCSVAAAGDVNRDGYADVVVGAMGVTNSAYVYQGSSNGIAGNPQILQPAKDGNDSQFGVSVASAGDVNGDGYGDLIVGDNLRGTSDVGAAFIYHGSNTGVATTAAVILQGNQTDANMGRSVAGAGDINGDGYSDVIVGAPDYENGQNNEGVVLAYYGSSAGIANASPVLLEMNKASSGFGSEVGSAGDVNGDGYSDIIVGDPVFTNGEQFEGAAYVFQGSPTGLELAPRFQLENTNISGARMGRAVAGAGDVNGDGYSDIIIGATGYPGGQNDAGSAFVYYGNTGKGLRNNVRLYNGDWVTPINHNQFNQTNFVATLFAKSFLGVNKGRFVWEAMGPGTPFSKVGSQPITTSNLFTGTAQNLIPLSVGGTLLGAPVNKNGIATKLRVRVRYSPVLAITGQMYGPWRYVQSQLAGYNNAPVPEEVMAETINGEAETSISLFPNPASDRLSVQVDNPSEIRSMRLFDTGGGLVFQTQRYERDIDVSKLPGGIYILMLNRANGTPTSHRILIRR